MKWLNLAIWFNLVAALLFVSASVVVRLAPMYWLKPPTLEPSSRRVQAEISSSADSERLRRIASELLEDRDKNASAGIKLASATFKAIGSICSLAAVFLLGGAIFSFKARQKIKAMVRDPLAPNAALNNETQDRLHTEHNRHSYKQRFIWSVMMAPLPVMLLLLMPEDFLDISLGGLGISISKVSVVSLMVLVFAVSAAYNFYMWKTKERPNDANPADAKNRRG